MATLTDVALARAQQAYELAYPYLDGVRKSVNSACEGLESWQIVACSIFITVLHVWLYHWIFVNELSPWERLKKTFFKIMRKLPYIGSLIEKELSKAKEDVKKAMFGMNEGQKYMTKLPEKGMTEDQIMKTIANYNKIHGAEWEEGRVSGTVYCGDQDLTNLTTKVYSSFVWSNPLHPDVFPAVRKMEAEVVAMTCRLFNGGPNTCGTMTSGGTESILMACKAYRDFAYDRGIKNPEILAPQSIHCAFDKAAHYFKMKVVRAPLDPKTWKCNVKAMAKMINKNTCLLAASAPGFPHGMIDPIEDIAKLAKRYNLPFHVDCCLGGFLLPFMVKAGHNIPPFDFRVDGVTSISADTHKYGFSPKGSSVVMYSDSKLRTYQYYVSTDWQGGIYASPSVAGSRGGAIIAATWATLVHIGQHGYIDSTQKIVSTAKHIATSLRKVNGIRVIGDPQVSVVAIRSDDFDIYRLSGDLTKMGWNLNSLQFPSSVHICVTLLHTKPGVADRFLKDVRECTAKIMKDPKAKAEGTAAIYGMSQSIPDRSMVGEIACTFLDCLYNTDNTTSAKATNGSKK